MMAAAGKLNAPLPCSVSPIGGKRIAGGGLVPLSNDGVASEWLPVTSDEEAMLHQFRAMLVQARDAPPGRNIEIFLLLLSVQYSIEHHKVFIYI